MGVPPMMRYGQDARATSGWQGFASASFSESWGYGRNG